jgi:ADP-ribose pyrophosphatase
MLLKHLFSQTVSDMPFRPKIHHKCRNTFYSTTQIERIRVPDDKVSFDIDFPAYKPVNYKAPELKKASWADPSNTSEIQFNSRDGKTDRLSFEGSYRVIEAIPINPIGRTGISGRGLLGKWGPNHAADPVLTKWKTDESTKNKIIDSISGKPILMFVAILRKNDNEWAIPGGMVDPGETISMTLKREFTEEALNSLSDSQSEININQIFQNGYLLYQGYVDDPRNTDNSWMETQVFNYHDDANIFSFLKLKAGSDAADVCWMETNSNLNLFASHKDFLKKTAELHNAHW